MTKQRPSVLVVHPDEGLLDMVEALASRMGAEVRRARSGEQAIDAFVQRPADVLVVGLTLPGRDGVRTVETLRWAPGGDQARVVLLTGELPTHRLQTVVRRIEPVHALLGRRPTPAELGGVLRKALRPRPTPPPSEPPPTSVPEPTVAVPLDATTAELVAPDAHGSGVREGRWVAQRFETLRDAARLQGDLEETPFAIVLARLAELRATGELAVDAASDPRTTTDGGPVRKVVRFRAGVPVQVLSNVHEERLGQVLVRRGTLDAEALEASLRHAEQHGIPHGEALVRMGLLDARALDEALHEQLRMRLFDLFSWRTGPFRFAEGPPPRPQGVGLEMSLPEMLLRGVTGHLDARLALARLRSWLDCAVQVEEEALAPFERLGLGEAGGWVLGKLRDGATLRELVSGSAERALLLFALWCGGAVHFREPSDRDPLQPGTVAQPVEPEPTQIGQGEGAGDEATRAAPVRTASPATEPQAAAATETLEVPHAEAFRLDANLERRLRAEQLFRQGVHALESNRPERATEAFAAACELAPDEGEFLAWLAYSRLAAGREAGEAEGVVERAHEEAERACRLAPELATVHLLAARIHEAAGRLEEASAAYRRVLALRPGDEEAAAALRRLEAPR